MILNCPACATRYLVDPAALGPGGRRVSCARCGFIWFQNSPDTIPTRIHVGPTASSAPDREARAVALPALPRRERPYGILLGWAAYVLTLGLLLVGLYVWRVPIVEAWPATARLYSALDIPVNVRGLAFSDVAYQPKPGGTKPGLVISGKIINTSHTARDVPPIRVVLRNETEDELRHTVIRASDRQLAPGRTTRFIAEFQDLPRSTRGLEVVFAADE